MARRECFEAPAATLQRAFFWQRIAPFLSGFSGSTIVTEPSATFLVCDAKKGWSAEGLSWASLGVPSLTERELAQ